MREKSASLAARIHCWPSGAAPARLTVTPAVLKRGVSLVLMLPWKTRLAIRFDALRLQASTLGDFHYIPVLFQRPSATSTSALLLPLWRVPWHTPGNTGLI
jgi:hypothetical protein